jgi:GNAT superfamily N-acetyltransferase
VIPVALRVRPLTDDAWPALEDLFGRAGASNGCWCMYWRLGPDYHRRPRELNKAALCHTAQQDPPRGLLAFDGDSDDERAVGWGLLAPRAELPWLDHARSLGPVDDLPVWSLPCLYIRRAHRGRGVMSALIAAALPAAKRAGAPALEAYPIDTSAPKATTNLFTGTASAFARAGFVEVARRSPARPIMRNDLRGVSA